MHDFIIIIIIIINGTTIRQLYWVPQTYFGKYLCKCTKHTSLRNKLLVAQIVNTSIRVITNIIIIIIIIMAL